MTVVLNTNKSMETKGYYYRPEPFMQAIEARHTVFFPSDRKTCAHYPTHFSLLPYTLQG